MILFLWLKSFPLPGSVILSAHLPSPVCKGYGSSASALHWYGVCFASNEIDSFANELSTRQIEKNLRVKHKKFKFSRRTKRYAKKKRKSLGLELRASYSETFHGIFAI